MRLRKIVDKFLRDLLIISEKDEQFYLYFLLSCIVKIVEGKEFKELSKKMNIDTPAFSNFTDENLPVIGYTPLLIDFLKEIKKFPQRNSFNYLSKHEVIHLISLHPIRFIEYIRTRNLIFSPMTISFLNLVADSLVNKHLPQDFIEASGSVPAYPENLTFEELADKYLKKAKESKKSRIKLKKQGKQGKKDKQSNQNQQNQQNNQQGQQQNNQQQSQQNQQNQSFNKNQNIQQTQQSQNQNQQSQSQQQNQSQQNLQSQNNQSQSQNQRNQNNINQNQTNQNQQAQSQSNQNQSNNQQQNQISQSQGQNQQQTSQSQPQSQNQQNQTQNQSDIDSEIDNQLEEIKTAKELLKKDLGIKDFKDMQDIIYEMLKKLAKMNHQQLQELKRQLQQEIKNRVEQIEKTIGTIPDEIEEIIKEYKTVHIRIENESEFFSEFQDVERLFIYPNFVNEDLPVYKPFAGSKVLLIIDTSGSIGKEEAEYFFGIIKNLTNKFEVLVIEIDAEIKNEKPFRFTKTKCDKLVFKGRGGTVFTDLERLDKILNYEQKESIKKVILLTDGYVWDFPRFKPLRKCEWIGVTTAVIPENSPEWIKKWFKIETLVVKV